MLIDAADYFLNLRRAILAAERSVVIVGWDIDSRVRLVPETKPEDGFPAELLPFLNAVLDKKPELHITLLAWDFAMIYTLEREFLPSYTFHKHAHPRLHFVLDGAHALGASHHQKLAVIDGCIAFSGGMDLTIRRWDRSAHSPKEAGRVDPAGEPYAPMHDVQVAVDGDAACAIFDLVKLRLEHALAYAEQSADHVPPPKLPEPEPERASSIWPKELAPDFENVDVGISRTHASTSGDEADVREIASLTRAAFSSARKYIFIENQYLTAALAGNELAKSLSQPEGPEIIAVLPKVESGWLEQSSMGVLRARTLEHLRRADEYGRLHIYYPHLPDLGEHSVNVHSKLLIIDGKFLKIGSSNLSNRSLGLDTECDLSIEAEAGDERTQAAITGVLCRLLGEHLGLAPEVCQRALDEVGSLAALIDSRRNESRTLKPLDWMAEDAPLNLEALGELVVDPERPMGPDAFVSSLLPAEVRLPIVRSLLATIGMIVPMALVFWFWNSLPADVSSTDRVFALLHTMREHPLSFVYVCAAFAVLGLAFVPITALIGATALVFDPAQAFVFSLCGALVSACLAYGVGRLAGSHVLRQLQGPRLRKLRRRLHAQAFRATVVARLLPVGNFSVINMFAGALRVPFLAYAAGNVVGMSFGIGGITFLADRLAAAWHAPSFSNIALLLVYVAGLFAISLGLSKVFERHGQK